MGSRIYGGQVGGDASLHYIIELLSSCETRPWHAKSVLTIYVAEVRGQTHTYLVSVTNVFVSLTLRFISSVYVKDRGGRHSP